MDCCTNRDISQHLDCPVNNSEKLAGGLVRPCGAVEGLGITAEANLKVSLEIKTRGLTNSNLECKGINHNVYLRFSVFLRFTNIFKDLPSRKTLC